ncbi:hypothetical protein MJ3_03652 [Salimicrobium jeotgali]|uniref:DUF2188 domain-containing protein n=1 Tax=Salimicrobium jeotgali TaxID=1230341 RepID=K2GE23_9BACI|nr:DUF2188 domain-containing protein [Salimicrobium jeotgali]EKE32497.1 hypothetical protein MJ3_03652 [Salimicrobium jeotgali]MBM7695520.1 uncharacterized protein YdaT [Salimicrobium jeotgali]
MTNNNKGRSGENRTEEQNKEYGRQGQYAKGNQQSGNSSNIGNSGNNTPDLSAKGEHVIAHEDGWAVQGESASQPTKVFDNKDEAVTRAKEIAQNKGGSVIIHKQDGTIQENISYDS